MKDLAQKALAAKLIADELKDIEKAAKAGLMDEFEASGADRVTVKDVDDVKLGVVSKGAGRVSATVVDEDAFADWVEKTYPDAIVRTVDPDVRLRLLNAAKKAGEPVDVATGEVIPGVEIKTGSAYVSARPTPEARERMHGLLASSGLLELAGGTGE
ncbi:hypothetical protein [Glycomyces arizonensis]|uniref:hypothetical protein n=1 Tax=Glycomyces arizonensis TaxID=256035 RepID=UPI0004027378|nr:hypothetical protein [Glycomyces arizonensis]